MSVKPNIIIIRFSAMKTITATELAKSIGGILDRVSAAGEEVLMVRDNRYIARLLPLSLDRPRRRLRLICMALCRTSRKTGSEASRAEHSRNGTIGRGLRPQCVEDPQVMAIELPIDNPKPNRLGKSADIS